MNEKNTSNKEQERDQIKNQWFLCPSKTFPNKFYYFDPASGVAVWNLDDVNQLPILEQQQKRQVPSTQPVNYLSNFVNNDIPSLPCQYFLNSYIPMVPFYPPVFMTPPPIQNLDTQPSCPTTNTEVVVGKTSVPLMDRFRRTRTMNIEKEQSVSANIEKSNVNNIEKSNTEVVIGKTSVPLTDRFQRTRTINIEKEQSVSPNIEKSNTEVVRGKTSVPLTGRLQITRTINIEKDQSVSANTEKSNGLSTDTVLRSDDLRHKLNKKRKSDDLQQNIDESVPGVPEVKLPNPSMKAPPSKTVEPPVRKFLYPAINEDFSNTRNTDVPSFDIDATCLKKLAKFTMRQDAWYIVVDTNILMYELTFVQKLVKSDPSCRLRIPYYAICELDGISSSPYRQARVVLARKAKRYLTRELPARKHVFAQKPWQASNIGSHFNKSDGAIECCQQLLDKHYFVVLLSNEQRLRVEASKVDIPSFSVNEIMEYMASSVKFDFEKPLKINIDNRKLLINNQPLCDANNNCTKINRSLNFSESNSNCENSILDDSITKYSTCMSLDDTGTNNSVCRPEISRTYASSEKLLEYQHTNVEIQRDFQEDKVLCLIKNDRITKNAMKNYLITENAMEIDENHNWIPNTGNTFDLTYSAMLDKYGGDKFKDDNQMTEENKSDYFDKGFKVKHKIMETRLRLRMYEWLCRLTQNMEDVLTEILLTKKKQFNFVLSPPWNLHEAIECVKICYKRGTEANRVANRMSATLLGCTHRNGTFFENLVPSEFMKLFSCAFQLLQAIKNTEPSNGIDYDRPIQLLEEMLRELESENLDPNAIFKYGNRESKNDSFILDTTGSMKDSNEELRSGRVQSYLLRHFPDVRKTVNGMKKPTIVRTLGVNLKRVKLTKDKILVLNEDCDMAEPRRETVKSKMTRKREILDLDVLDYLPMNEDPTSEDLKEVNKIDKNLQRRVECKNAPSLVKCFLLDVKETILLVKDYIDRSRIEEKLGFCDEYNENDIDKENVENRIRNIVSIMKRILHRETFEAENLNSLLEEAGLKQVLEDDKHFSQYKDVISKCLKHVEFLQEKLTNLT